MLSFKLLIPALLFVGCCKEMPELPKMEEVETFNFSWEDIYHPETKKAGHFLTPTEWQDIQENMIDRRYRANSCINATKPFQAK